VTKTEEVFPKIPAHASLDGAPSDKRGVDFEVLSFYHRVVGVALIVPGPVLGQFSGQGFLTRFIKARKRHLSRAEVFSKESYDVRWWKRIIKEQVLPRHPEARFSTQAFVNYLLISPQRRNRNARRGRRVARGDLEHLADEPVQRPVAHGDQAAGAAHPNQFRGNHVGAGANMAPN